MLQVKGISSGYKGKRVIEDNSLEVRAGEIISVIGANGAGKSTLLRTISGLLPARAGKIFFEDRNITRMPAHKIVGLGLVQVPEGRQLFGPLTAYQNLVLGCFAVQRLSKDIVREQFEFVYRLFPVLLERRDQRAQSMSGGEQQMLAIARALMSKPKLLLMDEPTLGLAPILVDAIGQTLFELNAGGLSILLVEQNAEMALSLAHRGYIMQLGKIVLQGASKELAMDERVIKAYLGGVPR